MEKAFLRPAEVCEIIGLGRTKTYDMLRKKEIPSIRIGGNVRIPVERLREWIQRQIDAGQAPVVEPKSDSPEVPTTNRVRRDSEKP